MARLDLRHVYNMAKRSAPRAKKPTMRKFRRKFARKQKSKASKNMDTYFLKANMTCTIAPQQGVVVANYLSWFPQLLDPTSAYGIAQSSEFNFWKKVYDQVRVNSMTIRVVPKANVLDQAIAQDDAAFRVTGDGLVHCVVDRDSLPPQNINNLTRYSSYQKHSVLKQWSRSYSIKYPVGVWLDTANIFEDETLLKRLGALGGIYLYAENMLEDLGELVNEPWATVHISYNCVFRGKTQGALTFGEDGSVTLLPADKLTRSPDTVPVVLHGAINSKRYDLNGDVVTVTDTDLP